MIKKIKFFSIIFSTIILLPFSSMAVSCGEKKVTRKSEISDILEKNTENETPIDEEIKDFIKASIYGKKNSSILELDELQENMTVQIKDDLTKYLETLNNKLNDTNSLMIELDNKIILQGLKKKISDNCEYIEKELKDPDWEVSSNFQTVKGKVLEVNEDSIFFNLKKFNLKNILDNNDENEEEPKLSEEEMQIDINDDQTEKHHIFADSAKLKIYNFSTDIKLTLTYDDEKKHLISIKDLNLFVVLEKGKALLLTEGITKYINDKIEKNIKNDEDNAIRVYLNGRPDRKINGYFPKIINKSNFNLMENENKFEIGDYFANIYLPRIIFNNNDKEKEIKVLTKKISIEEKDINIKELNNHDKEKVNFLKMFGNSGQKQITKDILDNNIKMENFLNDRTLYSYGKDNYFLLGKGSVTVNHWSIKGFFLNPITLKFKILIQENILQQQINDLKTCFDYFADAMKDSKAVKRNNDKNLTSITKQDDIKYNDKYTINIELLSKHFNLEEVKKVLPKTVKNSMELEDILNALYTEQVKKLSQGIFVEDSVNYKFTTKTNTVQDTLHFSKDSNSEKIFYSDNDKQNNSKILDSPINIYFIFNSFRINLTNDLLLKRRQIVPVATKIRKKEDGNKILFR